MAKEEQIKTFPSPRGDKLCQVRQQRQKSKAEVSFRPLAGISCVYLHRHGSAGQICFRPLAGISCVEIKPDTVCDFTGFRPLAGISCVESYNEAYSAAYEFPSPRGDKLCLQSASTSVEAKGFRPLAGISCVAVYSGEICRRPRFRPLAGISCVSATRLCPPY